MRKLNNHLAPYNYNRLGRVNAGSGPTMQVGRFGCFNVKPTLGFFGSDIFLGRLGSAKPEPLPSHLGRVWKKLPYMDLGTELTNRVPTSRGIRLIPK